MKIIQCLALCCAVSLTASGCVYRINIQQGNFLNQGAVDTVKEGMTRSQVRYLLGTPMVADSSMTGSQPSSTGRGPRISTRVVTSDM